MHILDRIVARKKEEVAELLRRGPGQPALPVDPPRGFFRALVESPGLSVIAEAKKASPSKGLICADFDPVAIAGSYERGGARALSVLTDVDFFQGDLNFIPAVRKAVSLPVLRKDFIIHEAQIDEAVTFGADAILLIAAILDDYQLRDYQAMAGELGLDTLVEVHDEYEAERALKADVRLLGVNNRDLRDFSVDLNTTLKVKRMVPEGLPLISESGIRNHDDVRMLSEHGIKGVLVGESLMRAGHRAQALRDLVGGLGRG
jgi:indole-3-glycerol phosphate synthase